MVRIVAALAVLALAACTSDRVEDRVEASVETAQVAGADSAGVWGSSWRLEDLGGNGVVDMVQATLEFPEPGKVAGSGSCNHFFGSVEVSRDSISFGPLASTRMACEEAVNDQEASYLAALGGAERFEIEEPHLLIYSSALQRPLRFIRADRRPESGANETER